MSWMPIELAISPGDREYNCHECDELLFAEEFTDSDEMICNDCYEGEVNND